ncbi:MAG: hypothetical protein HY903_17230 [Deltaproteobacteria bacterium]|nr:hypothetical protein [Deltaproteobacteria bacterium]
MRCRKAQMFISRQLDGRLDEETGVVLATHLCACADCARFAALVRESWRRLAADAPAVGTTPDVFAGIVERATRASPLAAWLGELWRLSPSRAATAGVLASVTAIGVTLGTLVGARLDAPPTAPVLLEAQALADSFADLPLGTPLADFAASFAGRRGSP